jgi:hypothetical protein
MKERNLHINPMRNLLISVLSNKKLKILIIFQSMKNNKEMETKIKAARKLAQKLSLNKLNKLNKQNKINFPNIFPEEIKRAKNFSARSPFMILKLEKLLERESSEWFIKPYINQLTLYMPLKRFQSK